LLILGQRDDFSSAFSGSVDINQFYQRGTDVWGRPFGLRRPPRPPGCARPDRLAKAPQGVPSGSRLDRVARRGGLGGRRRPKGLPHRAAGPQPKGTTPDGRCRRKRLLHESRRVLGRPRTTMVCPTEWVRAPGKSSRPEKNLRDCNTNSGTWLSPISRTSGLRLGTPASRRTCSVGTVRW
jgi:hypothetical protein